MLFKFCLLVGKNPSRLTDLQTLAIGRQTSGISKLRSYGYKLTDIGLAFYAFVYNDVIAACQHQKSLQIVN